MSVPLYRHIEHSVMRNLIFRDIPVCKVRRRRTCSVFVLKQTVQVSLFARHANILQAECSLSSVMHIALCYITFALHEVYYKEIICFRDNLSEFHVRCMLGSY